ncbi:MAG: 2-polyprenylphenol 6-hydroxylase [Hyphomicrobium sp.]
MASALRNVFRLTRAGLVLASHCVSFFPKGPQAPFVFKIIRILTFPIWLISFPFRIWQPTEKRLSNAFAALGPSYIKLGQFLATRGDIIGPELQKDLSHLQDRLTPFSMVEARKAIEASFGGRVEDHFDEFGPPVAAASIAQVHKAVVLKEGVRRIVAVKILRPQIEKRFRRDLDSYFFAAKLLEKWNPSTRRLRPVDVIKNLERTTELEMDLRLEAAAISEMAGNIKSEEKFRVPKVDWVRTAKRVLTTDWIDGIPISDKSALLNAGHDLYSLGLTVIRSFLSHAMRDGFFHADMHQGNLFVDKLGDIVAVDFGIMGRLGERERRFLAEILYGLITRDYRRAAEVHFWAGYVPPHHSIEVFAQALRAIGEPIHGKTAEDISMADLLGQLFAYTDVFDMQTRPELILLQKSMVIVEGVARSLNPKLNLWTAAEPIAKEWIDNNLSLKGRIRDVSEGAASLSQMIAALPHLVSNSERAMAAIIKISQEGVKMQGPSHDDNIYDVNAKTPWYAKVLLVVLSFALGLFLLDVLGYSFPSINYK